MCEPPLPPPFVLRLGHLVAMAAGRGKPGDPAKFAKASFRAEKRKVTLEHAQEIVTDKEPHWPTHTAQSCIMQVADLMAAKDLIARGEQRRLTDCRLSVFFLAGLVFRRDGEDSWRMSLGPIIGSYSFRSWPLIPVGLDQAVYLDATEHDSENVLCLFKLSPWNGSSAVRWHTCYDIMEYEVLQLKWIAPMEVDSFCGVRQVLLKAGFSNRGVPLLRHVAEQVFWDLGLQLLKRLAALLGLESRGLRLLSLLYGLIMHIVPDCDDVMALGFLQARYKLRDTDPLTAAVSESSDVYNMAPDDVQQQLGQHQERAEKQRQGKAQFKADLADLDKKVSEDRRARFRAKHGSDIYGRYAGPIGGGAGGGGARAGGAPAGRGRRAKMLEMNLPSTR